MNINRANTTQRLVAYFIDTIIIGAIVSAISKLVQVVIQFDTTLVETLIEQTSIKAMQVLDIISNGGVATDELQVLREYLLELAKYSGIQFAVNAGSSLVVFIVYMIVLPLKWEKQTIGRLVMKCKVIYPNENGLAPEEYKKKNIKAFVIREIVCGWILYYMIGGLIIDIIALVIYNKNKRTLADVISKTETVSYTDNPNPQQSPVVEDEIKVESDPFSIDPEQYKYDDKSDKKDDNYTIF